MRLSRLLLASLLIAPFLTARALAADEHPIPTWGGKPGIVDPADPPPDPPMGTVGVPIGGSNVTTPGPAEDLPAARASRAGLRYTLEGVEVRGNKSTLTRVVLRYVPFKAGDSLDVDDPNLALVRYRLLGTGWFRDANLSLKKGSRRGSVILVVDVEERNTIVINDLSLGVAADVDSTGKARPLTAFGGIDVSENNLAGTGTILGAAIAVADQQLGLRTRVFVPQVLGTEWILGGELLFNAAREFYGYKDVLVTDPMQRDPSLKQDVAIATYKRFGGRLSVGHEIGSASTNLFLDYRLEGLDAQMPLAASHVRGLDREPIDFHLQRGSSILSALRATLAYDTRDDPLLTQRGWHVLLSSDAAFAPIGSDYNFFKVQGRASRWVRLPWKHVVKVEGFAGAVFGEAPMFERFYAGDLSDLLPDRLLDLSFDRRTAPNFFGTAIGQIRTGEFAARLVGEYRIPIFRGTKAIYGADLFGSAGLYGVANARDFTDPARGYTDLARVPIDFTFNFGLRVDTAIGGVNLGLSTLFGFIPVKGGGP